MHKNERKLIFFEKKLWKYLHGIKNSHTFAPQSRNDGGIAQLVRAHDS